VPTIYGLVEDSQTGAVSRFRYSSVPLVSRP